MGWRVRQVFKQQLRRGHIEMSLTIERAGGAGHLVAGYVQAFRQSAELGLLTGEPDLNITHVNDGGELPEEPEFDPSRNLPGSRRRNGSLETPCARRKALPKRR